eukprot:gene646-989_t
MTFNYVDDDTNSTADAMTCPKSFQLAAAGDVKRCTAELCAMLTIGERVAYSGGELFKTSAAACTMLATTPDTTEASRFLCSPVRAASPEGDSDDGGDGGLIAAAVIGPILMMLICLAIVFGVYMHMKAVMDKQVDEELEDFEYANNKDFEGNVDQFDSTDLIATVSQNSQYDRL